MFSLGRSSSGAADATTAPPPEPPSPKFPSYLLPAFAIPFRRWRQSSTAAAHYPGSPPGDHAVPSLSSTPTDDSALPSPIEGPPTPPLPLSSSPFPSSSSEFPTAAVEGADGGDDLVKLTQTQPDTIRCSGCATDFAFGSQIVSKGFTGRYGRAWLVSPPDRNHLPADYHQHHSTISPSFRGDLINIRVGRPETRLLVTGSHLVADITCAACGAKVGWKYVDAKEESQKYKVGKFILETQRCLVHRSWEDVPLRDLPAVDADRRDPSFGSPPPRPQHWCLRDPFAARERDGIVVDLEESEDEGEREREEREKQQREAILFDSEDEDECEDLFCGTWDPEIARLRRIRKVKNQNQRGSKRGQT